MKIPDADALSDARKLVAEPRLKLVRNGADRGPSTTSCDLPAWGSHLGLHAHQLNEPEMPCLILALERPACVSLSRSKAGLSRRSGSQGTPMKEPPIPTRIALVALACVGMLSHGAAAQGLAPEGQGRSGLYRGRCSFHAGDDRPPRLGAGDLCDGAHARRE